MAVAHLEKLNDRQREAVEHGVAMPDRARRTHWRIVSLT
jgi:DNA helicase-2/ATP-dependent DNA helicase PcrA